VLSNSRVVARVRHEWKARWQRVRAEPDRGDTVQELAWVLFWLGVIVGATALIGPWVAGKVGSIIGF